MFSKIVRDFPSAISIFLVFFNDFVVEFSFISTNPAFSIKSKVVAAFIFTSAFSDAWQA